LGHSSTSTKHRLCLGLCLAWLVAALPGCSRETITDTASSGAVVDSAALRGLDREYLAQAADLQLAQSGQLYLVLDFAKPGMTLKLQGAVVWSCPLQFAPETDSAAVDAFIDRFSSGGSSPLRPVLRSALYSGTSMTPDSVLAIVGDAVNVEPNRLKRTIPGRFVIGWGDGLILDIVTETPGHPLSSYRSSIDELKEFLAHPLGRQTLNVHMDSREALSLFGAARQGLPTLVVY